MLLLGCLLPLQPPWPASVKAPLQCHRQSGGRCSRRWCHALAGCCMCMSVMYFRVGGARLGMSTAGGQAQRDGMHWCADCRRHENPQTWPGYELTWTIFGCDKDALRAASMMAILRSQQRSVFMRKSLKRRCLYSTCWGVASSRHFCETATSVHLCRLCPQPTSTAGWAAPVRLRLHVAGRTARACQPRSSQTAPSWT